MKNSWKKVSIQKIAEIANVGTATVDRALNNRTGVKKTTKMKILNALHYLEKDLGKKKKIFLLCQSGNAYNNTLKETLKEIVLKNQSFQVSSKFILTKEKITHDLKQGILKKNHYDGLIIVSTENKIVNEIVSEFSIKRKPVITLTSDLSETNRHAYVGNDQVAAGSTAAKLLTSLMRNKRGEILMIISQPFRCQQERELGFKKILRYEFPKIKITETIQTTDTSEESYKHVKKYIKDNGPPQGIYNITGGNLGVADALKELGAHDVHFVGHELNSNTKMLLKSDRMDYVIGHDVKYELKKSFKLIENYFNNYQVESFKSNILIFNKHNCPH